MRLRENRLHTYYHRKRIIEKDNEGCVTERYDLDIPFRGEFWPASGKVQAEQYGIRLNYIKNLRISEGYRIEPDKEGHLHYILDSGIDIQELDGISLYQAIEKERAFEPKLLCIGGKALILGGKAVLFCTKTRIVYKADHKIVAIKPYCFLTLEVESLCQ